MSEWTVPAGTEACREPAGFDVRVAETSTMALARVSGPLTLASAGRLLERLGPIARRGRMLVLDLRLVEFVDSDGARALLQLDGELRAGGGSLRLVLPPGGRVARTLSLLQLDRHFDTFDSASDAWLRRRTPS